MKFTPIIVALALSTAVMPLAAMQRMTDAELSQMRGALGVDALADLKVEMGVLSSFIPLAQNLQKLNVPMIFSQLGAKVEMLSDTQYTASLSDSLMGYGIKDTEMVGKISSAAFGQGAASRTGVVQITFPSTPTAGTDNVLASSIASMVPTLNGASMATFTLKDASLAGTKIWLQSNTR